MMYKGFKDIILYISYEKMKEKDKDVKGRIMRKSSFKPDATAPFHSYQCILNDEQKNDVFKLFHCFLCKLCSCCEIYRIYEANNQQMYFIHLQNLCLKS